MASRSLINPVVKPKSIQTIAYMNQTQTKPLQTKSSNRSNQKSKPVVSEPSSFVDEDKPVIIPSVQEEE